MLSRSAIKEMMTQGRIVITPAPLDRHIGPNSIDLHFGRDMLKWSEIQRSWRPMKTDAHGCWQLVPGQFYLAHTHETTHCKGFIPHVDGRSTAAREGLSVHLTAGLGDNGAQFEWTLEVTVAKAVSVRPGDRLVQVYFSPAFNKHAIQHFLDQGWLDLFNLYNNEDGLHGYNKQKGPTPARPLTDEDNIFRRKE